MISHIFCRKFSTKSESISLVKQVLFEKPIGCIKTIKGWAKSIRKMGKIVFIDVNDGSCFKSVQIVCPPEVLKEPVKWGSSVNVTGTVRETPKGQIEVHASELTIVGTCDITDDFPFTPKQKQSFDYYRQYLHFRPKVKYFASMLRLRSAVSLKIHEYFNENDFTLIHTPIITSGDCEGAAETFMVKPESQKLINIMKKKDDTDERAFFNSPAYLTVSGQLHLEAAVRSISKVYTFNPTFRAENSKSRLHLSEFYMVEAEEAFVSDLRDILHRIEECVKQVLNYLLSKHLNEINFMLEYNDVDLKQHLATLENTIKNPFAIMSFAEAKDLIDKNLDKLKLSNLSSSSLTKEEEIFLVKHNNDVPVFIIDWPKGEKPFYMKEENDLVKAVDLLVPIVGELCGGSLREDNYDILKQRLTERNTLDVLSWYLDLRKFGNVPTGGFGMGFERLLQFMLNIHNIKDTIPFPRWPHSLQM